MSDVMERLRNYIPGEHEEFVPEVNALAIAEIERKDAELAEWIAYADKLEAALKLATGQRSDILMRMHAEQGLRIVRPSVID